MKKVYFACAITSGRDYAHVYPAIVGYIKAGKGHVLSELFADASVEASKGIGVKQGMSAAEIWQWDLDWVREADVVIAEVSQPSLGVGYEIAKAHEWGKPVLALYHQREGHKLSSMIAGSPNVNVCSYDDIQETQAVIDKFLATI